LGGERFMAMIEISSGSPAEADFKSFNPKWSKRIIGRMGLMTPFGLDAR
jgi:hypothetical protein